MKAIFIPVQVKTIYTIPDKVVALLPKMLTLMTTVQYMRSLKGIIEQLEKAGIKVSVFKSSHSFKSGQILGCDVYEREGDCLFIGDGVFHPYALIFNNNSTVYCYNPLTEQLTTLSEKDVQRQTKRQKGALLKFKSSTKIGVLVSLKIGQSYLAKAESLKQMFPDKEFYIFICDTLNFTDLENFSFIESWVNSMCPRLSYDDAGFVDINNIIESTHDVSSMK